MSSLEKKLGPLPRWAWILLGFAVIGVVWYEHKKSSSTTSTTAASSTGLNQIDPETGMTYAQEAAESSQGIDPLTGVPYAQEQYGGAGSGGGGSDSGGGVNTSPPPSFSQELGDVATVIGELQALGLVAPAPGAGSSGSDNNLGGTNPGGPDIPASSPSPTPGPQPVAAPRAAAQHAGASAAAAVNRTIHDLGHGFSIENFRPSSVGAHESVVGIGHGMFETRPSSSPVRLTTNVSHDQQLVKAATAASHIRTNVKSKPRPRPQRNHQRGRK